MHYLEFLNFIFNLNNAKNFIFNLNKTKIFLRGFT